LGYRNVGDALKLCKKAVKYSPLKERRRYKVSIIPESDIYRLIFGSKIPQAIAFQDRVFEYVIGLNRYNELGIEGCEIFHMLKHWD
jgi:prophage antirepressor-like protein